MIKALVICASKSNMYLNHDLTMHDYFLSEFIDSQQLQSEKIPSQHQNNMTGWWAYNGCGVTANQPDPLGGYTASKLTPSTQAYNSRQLTISGIAPNEKYAIEVWLKKANSNVFTSNIAMWHQPGTWWQNTDLNLTTEWVKYKFIFTIPFIMTGNSVNFAIMPHSSVAPNPENEVLCWGWSVKKITGFEFGATCHVGIVTSNQFTPVGDFVTTQTNTANMVQYAIDNGYTCLIRNYMDNWYYKLEWDYAYKNGLQIYAAHGSNNYQELTNPPYLYSAINVGGGIDANIRSYGAGLEFFEATSQNLTAESWTTAALAAKLERIREMLGCSNWEARYRARQGASGGGAWNKYNGYGRPDVAGSLAWTGIVPRDPYIALTTPEIEFNRSDWSKINLNWNAIPNAQGYKIYRRENVFAEWQLIKTTTDLEYEDTELTSTKAYCYKVSAYNEYEEIMSDEIIIVGRKYDYELRKTYYA